MRRRQVAAVALLLVLGAAAAPASESPPPPRLTTLRAEAARTRAGAEQRRAEAERQLAQAQALHDEALARRNARAAEVAAQARENARQALAAAVEAIETATARIAELDRAIAEQQALRRRLTEVRGQVRATQETLGRLSRSIQGDTAQLAEWRRETERAVRAAWLRGRGMLIDETLRGLAGRLERSAGDADAEIRRAVERLAGETDPGRRERLHAAVKLLEGQRAELRQAHEAVVRRAQQAKALLDAAEWAESSAGDLEKTVTGLHQLVTLAVQDPAVQRAAAFAPGTVALARYGKSIADSAYDITAELIAWKRIIQLDRNSEAYLMAVGRLSTRLNHLVDRIHEIERALEP